VGFYYGLKHPSLSPGDVRPTITPREYIHLIADATRLVISSSPESSDTFRAGAGGPLGPVEISSLIKGLRRRLHERPRDATTNRMLAIAELHAGNGRAAVHHLAISVNILLAPARNECARQNLHARVELALLLPILVSLSLRLGRPALARCLLSAVLSRLIGG
jgi:hypothetical protein